MSTAYVDQDFRDRVMAAITQQPVPTPARSLRGGLRSGDRELIVGALWSAWHLATTRSSVIRRAARVQAAVLLVLASVLLVAGTALAAAGVVAVAQQATELHDSLPQATPDLASPSAPGDGAVLFVPPSPAIEEPGEDSPSAHPTTGPERTDPPTPKPATPKPTDAPAHAPPSTATPRPTDRPPRGHGSDDDGDDASPDPSDDGDGQDPEPSDDSGDDGGDDESDDGG